MILQKRDKHHIPSIKISVSGAADTAHCGMEALEKAKALGRIIAEKDCVLMTGATTGFPLWAAMGAKEAGGFSVGVSPAASEREHVEAYRLPLDFMDLIFYTGFGYAGRDILLTRSSDAVLIGCGRVGTIHEFTVAFEDNKPLGILEGEWTMDETIRGIIQRANRPSDRIIFDKEPKRLVERILELILKDKKKDDITYSNRPTKIEH